MPEPIKVGDKLWIDYEFKDRRYRRQGWETVTKVGRKYAHTNGRLKYDLETLLDVGDYGGRNKAWRSREEWERITKTQEAWVELRFRIHSTYSVKCSRENILEAERLLFGEASDT